MNLHSQLRGLVARFTTSAPAMATASFAVFVALVVAVGRSLPWFSSGLGRYAAALLLVEAVFLFGLTVALVFAKAAAVRRAEEKQRRMAALEDAISAHATSHKPNEDAVRMAARWPDEAAAVLCHALRNLQGTAWKRAKALVLSSGLFDTMARRVLDPDPNRAIEALSLIRGLDSPEARELIERGLSNTSAAARLVARIAILNGEDEAAWQRVLDDVPGLPFWQRMVLLEQVSSESWALRDFLDRSLRSGDDTRILAALEVLYGRQRMFPVEAPQSVARSQNVEVRIKFYKAFPFLANGIPDSPLLSNGLMDADWRVRAMAASACAYMRATGFTAHLTSMSIRATHSRSATRCAPWPRSAEPPPAVWNAWLRVTAPCRAASPRK
ncbi:MAG: hypothetical protein U0Q16_16045 [Bryobacteraceae bacterium]